MNKTININLGGIFFHIDELAYQKLKNYLDAIRRSLSDDPKGKDEIITDIESRIGELLSEKVKDVRQVVNEGDIDNIIDVMGKPEDYIDEGTFSDDTYSSQNTRSKKLYRDGDDKFLGGVSSGMAHYFGIDIIWVRLAWLVAAFGGGFGFIVYPILWILLPQANSTAEKLEMEGEHVNISSIEKKIRDEFSDVSEKIRHGIDDVSEKVKNADYNKYRDKAKSGSQDMVDTLGKLFTVLFMVLAKLIGVILLIISVSTILGLFISLVTAGSIGFFYEDWFYNNFDAINNSSLPIWGVSVLIFLLVGIPFIFLFFLGIKILSDNKTFFGRVAKMTLLGIWLVALLSAIFFGTQQLVKSAYKGSVIEKQEIGYILSDTLQIKILDNETISGKNYLKHRRGYQLVLDENDVKKIYSNDIKFNIHQADKNEIYLKLHKRSKGESEISARENARSIAYNFKKLDNRLLLNGYFLTETENKFRDQDIRIDLYVPENQIIYLDRSMRSFLYHVDNIQDIYDGDMPNHYYIMTKKGLNCMDCDEDEVQEKENDSSNSFNMNIDEDGVKINISSDENEKAEVIIDRNGVKIINSKDSI
ncbi:MAG: PspC domain-containing protein [Flavobacteriaceae bacterium]|nr:PspC domain-containing protein [Flavobacteriaceae bacterium]